LEPLEGATDAAGQGAGEHRLGDARHVFEEDVALAEVRGDGQGELRALADNDLLDVGDDLAGRGRHVDLTHTASVGCEFAGLLSGYPGRGRGATLPRASLCAPGKNSRCLGSQFEEE